MSQQQPINILKMFKNFFACKIVVAANQRYSEKFKDFSDSKIVLAATHQYSENVQKLFRLQNCRSRKSAISWKHSKIFPPAKTSQPQTICILETFKDFFGCKNVLVATHQNSENIQSLFRLQNCLSRKPSASWNYSKTFSAAKMSQQQPIKVLKIFKGSFACKIVFAAKHLYPAKFQRLFRLQSCPRRKSSISWKYSKTFSLANFSQQQPIIILKNFRVFRLQNCLSRKSSISWKYSKIFSPANLSQPQTIDILELFKDIFACEIVVAATHQYSENIQRLFRLQNCLSRKSSISWKYSKTFSPAKMSMPQIIDFQEMFEDFFACKIVLAAKHLYPGKIQSFFACKIVLAATHHNSENVQKLFSLQNCRSRKSAIS